MNNNAIYPSPIENLIVMIACVIIGACLTKFHTWSVNKARSEKDVAKEQVVGG